MLDPSLCWLGRSPQTEIPCEPLPQWASSFFFWTLPTFPKACVVHLTPSQRREQPSSSDRIEKQRFRARSNNGESQGLGLRLTPSLPSSPPGSSYTESQWPRLNYACSTVGRFTLPEWETRIAAPSALSHTHTHTHIHSYKVCCLERTLD